MSTKLHSHCGYGTVLLNISITTLTKAQKRWRIACTVIYISRAMLSLVRKIVSEKNHQHHLSGILPSPSHIVLNIVQTTPHDVGIENANGSHMPNSEILHEADVHKRDDPHGSHMTNSENLHEADMPKTEDPPGSSHLPKTENLHCSGFPSIDRIKLTEMVKDKNLYELRNFGGIEGLATALETDPERGICGRDDDISRRHDMFRSNTYHRPTPKGLF